MSSTLSAARRAKFIELRRESHANEFLPCSTPDNHSPISGRADQAPGADCSLAIIRYLTRIPQVRYPSNGG